MARIRTIKPGFFKHEDLYDLEAETGLPVRVAFAGLWTVADREGRFKWKLRTLKSDVLPFDECDFGDVMAALVKGGFVIEYEVDGCKYGAIPSFSDHQHINSKEQPSQIPAPDGESTGKHILAPDKRKNDTEIPTRKGREGKGKEGEAHTRKRGVRIPDDFPTEEEINYALQKLKAPSDVVERERQKFRRYYLSEDCKRPARKDWPATWRNWWENVNDWSSGSARGQPRPGSEDATMEMVRTMRDRQQRSMEQSG